MTDTPKAPKPRKLFLSKDPAEAEYRVEKVVDSAEYAPGSYINASEVEDLCGDALWTVTISRPPK